MALSAQKEHPLRHGRGGHDPLPDVVAGQNLAARPGLQHHHRTVDAGDVDPPRPGHRRRLYLAGQTLAVDRLARLRLQATDPAAVLDVIVVFADTQRGWNVVPLAAHLPLLDGLAVLQT